MERSSDVNWYTSVLFLIGCASLVELWQKLQLHPWSPLLIMFLFSLILSFFPIRLPRGKAIGNEYSTGNVGFIFLLLYFGIGASLAALWADTLILNIRHAHSKSQKISWFRLFSTMGMYNVCALADAALIKNFPHLPLWLMSALLLFIFDALNLLMLLGVRDSVGEKVSMQTYLNSWQFMIYPMFICAVVLTTILKPYHDPLHLILDCIYSFLILFSIIYLTRQHAKATTMYQTIASKQQIITDHTRDLITIVDPKRDVTYASPSHLTLLGRSPKHIEGQSLDGVIHKDDVAQVKSAIHSALYNHAEFTLPVRFVHEDGRPILTEIKGSSVTGEDGDVRHVVMVARDLSERVEVDEMLRRSDRLAVVGQLAAGVAHEIRNPLTSVKGFLKIIAKNPADLARFLPILWAEFNQIETVINEFLVWSKPQFGQYMNEDIVSLVGNAVAMLEPHAKFCNVEIRILPTEYIPPVYCNANHIKQVFVNVLKNAIESMPHGGLVDIDIELEEKCVIVRITDEGCGIDEENLKRIGDPFFTTKSDGTGLGMVVSFKIISDHGGTIRLTSDGVQGTTVEIRLPLETSQQIQLVETSAL